MPNVITILAGGTGGAKLAAGMADVVGAAELTVVANTADDVEVYAAHVSPDPDLVTWWLAGLIDERGWGIWGDTWHVMEGLESAGWPTWFRLGDRDLAFCLMRTAELQAGKRLTEAHAAVVLGAGVESRVLPMSDEPVRTHVRTGPDWRPFQEFMIVDQAAAPIDGLAFRGIQDARPSPEVLDAIATAEAIVIGPSNPIISIRPILNLPGLRQALVDSPAPVVAVSPFVGGHAIKGPSDAFMEFAGLPLGPDGVLAAYAGVIDGLVTDEPPEGEAAVPVHVTDTLMPDDAGRQRVAAATLEFARSLAAGARDPHR
ncbi:MAG: 2-phospho-L-lactate transferase [Thermoleophilales bacterium]|nr:2-phospho-L-lactate transferase [Thermoleophilales bacterium]